MLCFATIALEGLAFATLAEILHWHIAAESCADDVGAVDEAVRHSCVPSFSTICIFGTVLSHFLFLLGSARQVLGLKRRPGPRQGQPPKKAKDSLRAASVDDYDSDLRLELFKEAGSGAITTNKIGLALTTDQCLSVRHNAVSLLTQT